MTPNGMTALELTIRGMDCADCVRTVETALNSLPGVTSARVILTAERGTVVYDPSVLQPQRIVDAVNATGYSAEVRDGEGERSGPPARSFHWPALGLVALLAGLSLLALTELIVEGAPGARLIPWWLALPAVVTGAWPITRRAVGALRQKQITADLLMSIAILAALALGEFVAAMLVTFFMRIAHALESFTTTRARHAIQSLVRLAPDTAHVMRAGMEIEIPSRDLKVGDVLIVRPGERIAADGTVDDGHASVDQSPITGESMPVEKLPGDEVFAGTLNQRGALSVSVMRVGAQTMLGRIARAVEEAEASKARVQRFADRYSSLLLPVLLLVAVVVSVLTDQPHKGIAVLVVACPCAVALATPLSVTASVGAAARHGILIKGGLYLEALARADVLVMDKTGTLTLGKPRVVSVEPLIDGQPAATRAHILALAASAEIRSEHPLAEAILNEARRLGVHAREPESFDAEVGGGVSVYADGRAILLGSRRWLSERGVDFDSAADGWIAGFESEGKTVVAVASDGKAVGVIAASDVLREEVPAALRQLRRLGLRRMILLSGDHHRSAELVGDQLQIEARGGMLPADKIAFVRELQAQGHIVAMIGDGINDAPALAQADVGIAMGAAGTDLAIEAADIALMRDDWSVLPMAVRIARRTFGTIRQNIAFGVLFNLAGVTLAALGILQPIVAAAAQSLPDVAVFLNSSRLLRVK